MANRRSPGARRLVQTYQIRKLAISQKSAISYLEAWDLASLRTGRAGDFPGAVVKIYRRNLPKNLEA